MTREEVEALIKAPDTDTPLGLRDRAFFEVLYATGLRVSELVGSRWTILILRPVLLSSWARAQKQRIVPLGEMAIGWLRSYLTQVRPGFDETQASTPLFLSIAAARHEPTGILEAHQTILPVPRGSQKKYRPIRCAIHLPRMCLKAAPTCAPCR